MHKADLPFTNEALAVPSSPQRVLVAALTVSKYFCLFSIKVFVNSHWFLSSTSYKVVGVSEHINGNQSVARNDEVFNRRLKSSLHNRSRKTCLRVLKYKLLPPRGKGVPRGGKW